MISPKSKTMTASYVSIETGALTNCILIANYKQSGELKTKSFVDQATRLLTEVSKIFNNNVF
jgi:hypothetical protein